MPRRPRLKLADVPFHVIQRANNRVPCFVSHDDRVHYLDLMHSAVSDYHVAVHAYVLMTNHVHLLMTGPEPEAISRTMHRVDQRYAQYFNRQYDRSGSLWQGRFKACLVDAESYLLACHRYVECNPVRAGIVTRPEDYRWSSYRANALGAQDALVSPHPLIARLSGDAEQSRAAYRMLFMDNLDAATIEDIRAVTAGELALGSDSFKAEVAQKVGRPVGQPRRGRPVVKK